MHCGRCQAPVTSKWLREATPLRLACPECGADRSEPYPALPMVQCEGLAASSGRRMPIWVPVVSVVVCLAAVGIVLLVLPPRLDVEVSTVDSLHDTLGLRALPSPADDAKEPAPVRPSPAPVRPKPAVPVPSLQKPPTPSPMHRPTAPRPAPVRGAGPGPARALPTAPTPVPSVGSRQPHDTGSPGLVIRPLVFSGLAPVRCLACCPGTALLASGHDDARLRLWDLHSPSSDPRIIKSEDGQPLSLEFTADGRQIAVLTRRRVTFYNLPDGAEASHIESGQELSSFSFSAQGEYLAMAHSAGSVMVRAMSTLNIVDRIPSFGGVQAVAWRRATPELAVACADNAVRLWDLDRGLVPRLLLGHDDWVSALAATRDGLVTGGWDMTVRLWHLRSNREPRTLRGHAAKVTAVAATEGGKAVVSGDEAGVVKVWDSSSSMEMLTIRAHAGRITGIVFVTPEWLVTAGEDGSARAWRVSAATDAYMTELLSRSRTDGLAQRPRLAQYAQLADEANGLMRQTRYEQAIERFREAAKCRPGYADAHFCLAEALHAAGRLPEAIGSHKLAVKLRPDFGWAWYRLGEVLLEVGEVELAAEVLERACALLPDLVPARASLGRGLLAVKRYGDARKAFEAVLSPAPTRHGARRGLGMALAGLGEWEEAIAELQKAIDLRRDYGPAYSDLIDTLLASGKGREKEAEGWARLAGSLGIELRAATRERLKGQAR